MLVFQVEIPPVLQLYEKLRQREPRVEALSRVTFKHSGFAFATDEPEQKAGHEAFPQMFEHLAVEEQRISVHS